MSPEQEVQYQEDTINALQTLNGKLDILAHAQYTQSDYLSYIVVCLMLVSAILMFLLGYVLTRR